MSDLLTVRTTSFSPDRRYRYWLEVIWDARKPPLVACMLNPSTADEVKNDPTVERQCRRATRWDLGGLIVVNVFAFRSTDPQALYDEPDPVGVENDCYIIAASQRVGIGGVFLCGWGGHVEEVMPGRAQEVLGLIRGAGARPTALRVNADGSPGHPLYIGYKVAPKLYSVAG